MHPLQQVDGQLPLGTLFTGTDRWAKSNDALRKSERINIDDDDDDDDDDDEVDDDHHPHHIMFLVLLH